MTRKAKDKIASAVTRPWGETPVVDAEHDLRVFIQPIDVKTAKRKRPDACVFAMACKRAFGSTKVWFLRSFAYVELAGEDGQRRVERFRLAAGMRELIEAFDQGKGVIPQAGFLLKAPSRSQTLDYKNSKEYRQREKERRQRRERAVAAGTYKRRGRQGLGTKGTHLEKDAVRNGSGASLPFRRRSNAPKRARYLKVPIGGQAHVAKGK